MERKIMEKYDLEQKMKEIESFFERLSVEEFEKMAFDCGLGQIKKSKDSTYVLATQSYSDQIRYIKNTKDNEFSLDMEDYIKGAA